MVGPEKVIERISDGVKNRKLEGISGGVHAVDERHDHVEHDNVGARCGMACQQVLATRNECNIDRRTRFGRPAVDHAVQVI